MTIALDWLPELAFSYLLLFARLGAFLMLAPALGESSIPARIRLSFALLLALVLQPMLADRLPALPNDLAGLLMPMLREIAIGLILGVLTRLLTMATQVAGSIIAFQAGLGIAQTADPTQGGQQGAIFGGFLSMLAVALVFATNLHHLLIAALIDSYMIFEPGADLMLDDAAQMAIDVIAQGFNLGVQMAAPFIVFGLVFNLGAGILARLMPQLQVYFVLMPANIFVGILLFALLLVMMMTWYLTAFEQHVSMLRGAG
ncbi:flagellar biosynthetic protein FliR [Devosia pacifica]|uniref:Flagellar biosynthetic protein FliR n=1 Tax=Devosia pacifica TaxID=1335967 RepID=A0A918VQM8_9HYPH|nr:flagellar biosynthetic protein FliR [Devosia pacifica]GHA14548.1 flagellar biosynthetic protein FliR [Devosia pacifica]